MPLPAAAPRQPIHHRSVDCRGYRRDDGAWDIEGHLRDVKAYPFDNEWRGQLEPGEPVHEMWIRLTVDDSLTIIDVVVVADAVPFEVCPAIVPAFQQLRGLTIGRGWRREVLARLGGARGCTHLVELLAPLATAAYQTVYPMLARSESLDQKTRPPSHLDSCHALKRDGEIVRRHYARWYTGDDRGEDAD